MSITAKTCHPCFLCHGGVAHGVPQGVGPFGWHQGARA